jgi:2,3-bisphosphoglycerate-dependent phosphoglycerate mutase
MSIGIVICMDEHTESRPAAWLVRHGQSTWNARLLRQGQSDEARLTGRGYQQASRALDSLKAEDIGVVYCSDLQRTRQTASIIARGLGCDLIADKRLRERSFGRAEGSRLAELGPDRVGIVGGRVVDIDARADGGESLSDLYVRISGFLAWLAAQQGQRDVVVVAHGGSIRMLEVSMAGGDLVGMRWDAVPNGSIRRLDLPITTTVMC